MYAKPSARRTPYTPLTAAQEASLFEAFTNGSAAARTNLLKAFEPIINARVRAIGKSRTEDLLEDLLQEARIGFLRALETYDPARGFRIATYARPWIDQYIRDALDAGFGVLPFMTTILHKRMRNHWAKAERAALHEANTKGQRLGPNALARNVANRLGATEQDLARYMALTKGGFSLDAPALDDSPATELPDTGTISSDEVIRRLDNGKLEARVGNALANLSPRAAEIVRARIMADEPRTLDSLGKRYGISRERVRQIEATALKALEGTLRPVVRAHA